MIFFYFGDTITGPHVSSRQGNTKKILVIFLCFLLIQVLLTASSRIILMYSAPIDMENDVPGTSGRINMIANMPLCQYIANNSTIERRWVGEVGGAGIAGEEGEGQGRWA